MKPIDVRFKQLNELHKAGELSAAELEAEKTKALAAWINPDAGSTAAVAESNQTPNPATALGLNLNLNTIPKIMTLIMALGMTGATVGIGNIAKAMLSIGGTQKQAAWVHLITVLEGMLLLCFFYHYSRTIYRNMVIKRQLNVQSAHDPIARHVLEPFDPKGRVRLAVSVLAVLWYSLFRFSFEH